MKSFFAWLADRMIFEATQHPIDPEDRLRRPIDFDGGTFESWIISNIDSDSSQEPIFVLKFPGTGGRAERGGPHPLDIIQPENHEVWTINLPGYGTSEGKPSLKTVKDAFDSAWLEFSERAGSHRKLVVGNSLGCMYALYVAACYPVDGIFVRNPVPLKELIIGRYSWWNFGIGTRQVANQVPKAMDSIANAGRCQAPALFVMQP